MSYVHCGICKAVLDRDLVVGYKINNRYYCKDCYYIKLAEIEDEKKRKENFKIFSDEICTLFGLKVTGPKINAQRKNLNNQGYSDEEICYTLQYIFKVKHRSKAQESLGLVPYYFKEATEAREKKIIEEKNLYSTIEKNENIIRDNGIRQEPAIKEVKDEYNFNQNILQILGEDMNDSK